MSGLRACRMSWIGWNSPRSLAVTGGYSRFPPRRRTISQRPQNAPPRSIEGFLRVSQHARNLPAKCATCLQSVRNLSQTVSKVSQSVYNVSQSVSPLAVTGGIWSIPPSLAVTGGNLEYPPISGRHAGNLEYPPLWRSCGISLVSPLSDGVSSRGS